MYCCYVLHFYHDDETYHHHSYAFFIFIMICVIIIIQLHFYYDICHHHLLWYVSENRKVHMALRPPRGAPRALPPQILRNPVFVRNTRIHLCAIICHIIIHSVTSSSAHTPEDRVPKFQKKHPSWVPKKHPMPSFAFLYVLIWHVLSSLLNVFVYMDFHHCVR
jgi:hypothetical protein